MDQRPLMDSLNSSFRERTKRSTNGASLPEAEHEVDLYRETPVRLLGYSNEVGEAFRALVNVWVVRFSYFAASAYVAADTWDKSQKSYKKDEQSPGIIRWKNAVITSVDTLLWQALASVIVPGFTINRLCALSLFVLARKSPWSPATQKWITAAVGLGCIPFIVHPIDCSVDYAMDKTVRLLILPMSTSQKK